MTIKAEIEELSELVDELTNLREKCWLCGSMPVTRHSISGGHTPPYIYVCRSCHDLLEGYKKIINVLKDKEKLSITNFKRMNKTIENFK